MPQIAENIAATKQMDNNFFTLCILQIRYETKKMISPFLMISIVLFYHKFPLMSTIFLQNTLWDLPADIKAGLFGRNSYYFPYY